MMEYFLVSRVKENKRKGTSLDERNEETGVKGKDSHVTFYSRKELPRGSHSSRNKRDGGKETRESESDKKMKLNVRMRDTCNARKKSKTWLH